ncbi:MAG: hypothetical protein KBS56_00720 [Clostridiales bacterium]|nr:hypothetical protein [Candidatus Crickella equi]
MKNIKKRIALIFSVACAATLLFTIPTFACDNHDHGKHGGFFYPTQTKSWFGSCDGSYQDEGNVEPTLDTEKSVQPFVEETVQEESEQVQEKSVDCQYKKWKTENQNEYNPWLKSRTSITKDNLYASPELNKSSDWKTKLTTQSESGSWGIKPTHVIIKYITPPKETNSPHSILLMVSKVKIEKDNQSNKEKVIYVPWYQTGNSINNKRVQGGFIPAWHPVDMMSSKHHIHPFIGHNGITRPAQTTTIYKTHNSNTDMRTIHIRELETFGPYAVNNNRKFSDEYGKLVPRQIQHIEPHRIVEDNIYKKDSTQPQKWIINELRTPETRISGHWGFEEELASHLRIQFYHGGIANESTRKDIGFILLRHGVPVIHNNENIYHLEPSRIRHIYPSVMDEKHGISRFVPVFDNASTTKLEKQGLVKVRLYRPFSTSNFSNITETYLEPLRLIPGLIIQNEANKPISTMFAQLIRIAKPIQNNEEIQRRGMEYRGRESLGHSWPIARELRGKQFMKIVSLAPEINGAGKTTIIKILTGKQMLNRPMRTATITQLFLRGGQLETATQIGGGQHQRVAVARQLLPYFC